MSLAYIFIAVVLITVIMGLILGPIFASRNRLERLRNIFGDEYDLTGGTLGSEKKAETELNERKEYVKALDIRPLSVSEQERYQTDWASVQTEFVDQPGQAVIDADGLIMEVMQLRNYPISDFEQRAADVSVSYPALVGNYRAAREIAIKNEQNQANTEELRLAVIYYRSLFEELLGREAVAA
jgi:hypothetical protein